MGHYLFESRGRDHVGRFSEKSVCNIKIAEEAEPPTLSFENYLAAVLSGKWRSLLRHLTACFTCPLKPSARPTS